MPLTRRERRRLAAKANSRSATTATTTKKSADNPRRMQSSPLFTKLSPELRNHVYRAALVSDEPISIFDVQKRSMLFETCKQTRDEARGILFENTLRITCGVGEGEKAAKWLEHLTKTSATAKFKEIKIEFDIKQELVDALEETDKLAVELIPGNPRRRQPGYDKMVMTALNSNCDGIADILVKEACNLASANVAATKGGAIPRGGVTIREPAVDPENPRGGLQFGPESAMIFMYTFFHGIGDARVDAHREAVLAEGYGGQERQNCWAKAAYVWLEVTPDKWGCGQCYWRIR